MLTVHRFTSLSDCQFSVKGYSLFKHGCPIYTQQFATEMAAMLADYIAASQIRLPLAITGAPYNHLPVASTFLARQTAQLLSMQIDNPVREFKIRRQHSYITEYGSMDAAKRTEVIQSEDFHFSTQGIEDHLLIFIDDVRITGAHHRRIADMLRREHIAQPHCYAFYAYLDNSACTPTIEDQLNHAYIKPGKVDTLSSLIEGPEILFNTRVTKLMLSLNSADFSALLQQLSADQRQSLYQAAKANNYGIHPKFSANWHSLKKVGTLLEPIA